MAFGSNFAALQEIPDRATAASASTHRLRQMRHRSSAALRAGPLVSIPLVPRPIRRVSRAQPVARMTHVHQVVDGQVPHLTIDAARHSSLQVSSTTGGAAFQIGGRCVTGARTAMVHRRRSARAAS